MILFYQGYELRRYCEYHTVGQIICTIAKCPILFSDRMEVTGLEEGKWYAYRVKALNRLGPSKPSKPTDEIQAVDTQGIYFCFCFLLLFYQ